jgi:two-component system chemotaxis response regulator CheB
MNRTSPHADAAERANATPIRRRRSRTGRQFAVVVIGASAGGLDPLLKVVGNLRPDFEAAVLIVSHVREPSFLPQILQRPSSLPVAHAADWDTVDPGRVLVAPPDHHLVLHDHRMLLSRGPKQNGSRPAIDPLLVSAARVFGRRVIGVVLSGTLDDGSGGLAEIKRVGGVTIVQDPADAASPEMPHNAISATQVDYILPSGEIASKLNELVVSAPRNNGKVMKQTAISKQLKAVEHGEADPAVRPPGRLSTLTCPECGGTLWELHQGNLLRFGCHVGHNLSAQSMLAAQADGVEAALWVALRSLKERSRLLRSLSDHARRGRRLHSQHHYERQATEVEHRAEVLRRVLLGPTPAVRLKGRRK